MAKLGFDALESYHQKSFSIEGQPSQRSERVGFNAGKKLSEQRQTERLCKEATSLFLLGPKL